MKIQENSFYNLVSIDASSFEEFTLNISSLMTNNLVIEVFENLNIDETKISLFLDFSARFKENGMSFVLIKSGIDIDDYPESLNIAPTLQEAEDILEMEAIERDLGF